MDLAENTILLIEDNTSDVLLIQRALETSLVANPLQVVRDGEAAVQYLAGEGPYADRAEFPFPSLVLLDLKLPRKSGLEVLSSIRQDPRLAGLRVVVLTSSEEVKDMTKAYELGASTYAIKPLKGDDLPTIMQQLGLKFVIVPTGESSDA